MRAAMICWYFRHRSDEFYARQALAVALLGVTPLLQWWPSDLLFSWQQLPNRGSSNAQRTKTEVLA